MARSRGLVRWTLAAAERHWARRASRVVTVNQDYADLLASRLGVKRPLVVMNCSYRYEPPEPRARRFHEVLGLPQESRVVLYHGGLFLSADRAVDRRHRTRARCHARTDGLRRA